MRTPPRGQGMLEMIIALGIIVSGLTSALALTTGSLNASNESQTRVVATGLAREAVEIARQLRDSAWRAGQPWNADLGSGSDRTGYFWLHPVKGWRFDGVLNAIDEDAAAVYEDPDGFYRQSSSGAPAGARPTAYRRLVRLWPICMVEGDTATIAAVEAAACPGGQIEVGTDVRVEVTWAVSGRGHRLEIEQHLYDWR